MLALAAEKTRGAHPYFVTPEHTRRAREIMGPDAWLCPEQKVLLINTNGVQQFGQKVQVNGGHAKILCR